MLADEPMGAKAHSGTEHGARSCGAALASPKWRTSEAAPFRDVLGNVRSALRMLNRQRPRVSILIKALNEENNIAETIESAIAALDGMSGEIILADSLSTDSTVEIAKRYPIRIVTLARTKDRSCGVGAQLGYQYSSGDYICLMDGDQRLYRGFLAAAIECLEADRTLAGVGGAIVEREEGNLEYIKRATRDDPDRRPGYVTRLDCGGVYRRTAIEFDRLLHRPQSSQRGRVRSWCAPECARLATGPHRSARHRSLRPSWKRVRIVGASRALSHGVWSRRDASRCFRPAPLCLCDASPLEIVHAVDRHASLVGMPDCDAVSFSWRDASHIRIGGTDTLPDRIDDPAVPLGQPGPLLGGRVERLRPVFHSRTPAAPNRSGRLD